MAKRTLGVVRLSVEKEESTSPQRQKEIITAAALARGSTIAGWAEDLDVSASKTHPMERPGLASWLARPDEFDEILFWRVDRLVRKVGDFADMIKWSTEHSKGLASATEQFDLATPIGKALAYLIAIFAEMESSATSERVTGSHKYLREHGRYAGGKPPYGYVAMPNPEGNGWRLIPDPETAPVVREAVARVIAREAVNAIAADFNRRGIPPPRDRLRKAPNGDPWRVASLSRILRSPALLGHAIHGKHSVIGDDGMPVMRGEPLISELDYDQLQNALAEASVTKRRTQTRSPLLDVIYCVKCGAKLDRAERDDRRRGKVYRTYHCRAARKPGENGYRCNSKTIPADWLERIVTGVFLSMTGDLDVMERIYRPGQDHSEEIAQVRRALDNVRAEYDRGGYSYSGGQADYDQRSGALSARLADLLSRPVVAAGFDKRPTGKTYRQLWDDSDTLGQRMLMVKAGYEFRAGKENGAVTVAFQLDPELAARAQAAAAGEPVQLPEHDAIQASFEVPGHSVTFGSVEEMAAWLTRAQDAGGVP